MTLTAQVINLGPSDSTGIAFLLQIPSTFGDPTGLPPGFSYTRPSSTNVSICSNQSIPAFDALNVGAQQTLTVSMNFSVPSNWSVVATPFIVVYVTTQSDFEIDVSNNILTATSSVFSSYDLLLDVYSVPNPVTSGTALTYEVPFLSKFNLFILTR